MSKLCLILENEWRQNDLTSKINVFYLLTKKTGTIDVYNFYLRCLGRNVDKTRGIRGENEYPRYLDTGCPIKNEPTLEIHHFLTVRYFFKRFKGGERSVHPLLKV